MNAVPIPEGLDHVHAVGSGPESQEEAGRVEFRILGPLDVVGADGPLDLRGAKRRGLVALLAVHAGQWLSLDRIVDDLWGADPPSGAAGTVQTYVSQLRRALDPLEVTIPNRDGSYRLDVHLDALDSWRFEQQVREAGDVADNDDRLRLVDAALALWHGVPLDEFDQPWATRERARLQLLHLQARDIQLDARLALGGDRDLVDELEQLVDQHPLDERFWAKLLLAYYRSGRQADALRAFQRVRTVLAEELGIDPGPELVALEQRILQHDDSLLEPRDHAPGATTTLPTGTVTFLFTDIAESTRLWEEHPDEMADVIVQHHTLLTESIETSHGHVVKTIGDGLMAVFAEAPNAVAAAVAGQRAIVATDWPVPLHVRMGLHTGAAHLIDGDYHAPTVNRAARIAGAAHPEQIVLSETTASLAEESPLRDLGEHQLRGMAPVRLYQVCVPELPDEFPALATTSMSTLPMSPTSFVGRDRELAALEALVRAHALVTITGSGGCGKTRLAIESARHLAPSFVDGVRFVDLATVTDEKGLDDAVGDGLGLTADLGGSDTRARLVDYVGSREMLVILDNCEHLLDMCADLAEAILTTGSASRLLATSREPLGVVGEHVFIVPSLDVDTEAIGLFEDRAQAARADFAFDDTNLVAVRQICRRLDGIPLAIELAAARVSHLSPSQILERLDDRFRLLTGGQRRIQRQHTLAAALDWSYDLLDADDQETLRSLAVFPAGFSLEAAEAVVDRSDVLDRLASLVAKSLVQTTEDDETVRYRLLESVRLYAEGKLLDADEAEPARTSHRDWVLDWLESVPLEQRLLGDHNLVETAFPSVRAAIEWSVARGDIETAARIAGGVDWSRTEGWSEGSRWCDRLQSEPGLPNDLRAPLCLALWWLDPLSRAAGRWGSVLVETTEHATSPLRALARAALGRDCIVPSLARQDQELHDLAISSTEAAVASSADGPRPWHLYCRYNAGMVYASFRDPEAAAAHFNAGIEQPLGPPYLGLDAALRAYLAIMQFCMGDMKSAFELARESYATDLGVPYQHSRPISLVALAGEGDFDLARQALREYSDAAHVSDWPYASESVTNLGAVLAGLAGDWETAAQLLAAGSQAVFRDPCNSLLYFTYRDKARDVLGRDRARALRDEGRAMPLKAAVELALG